MKRFCCVAMIVMVVTGSQCCAMAGKAAPEQLVTDDYFPNAYELMGKILYVAQNDPKASDDNPGTKERPFKTIGKAGSVVDQGDLVMIDEGVYREEVPLLKNGHRWGPWAMITFNAQRGKRVYLKGSDVFEPKWMPLGDGVFKAKLPQRLFAKDVYNPYELSCVIDDPDKIRPTKGDILPETLGQIYVAGKALDQLISIKALKNTAGSFVVSADGKEIIVHFADGKAPKGKLVELTARQRCFKPNFSGTAFMQTIGMVIEHAAEPGPFCYGRALSIRKNPSTGIKIRKTFSMYSGMVQVNKMYSPRYISKDDPTIIATIIDEKKPASPVDNHKKFMVKSRDAGKTWEVQPLEDASKSRFLHIEGSGN